MEHPESALGSGHCAALARREGASRAIPPRVPKSEAMNRPNDSTSRTGNSQTGPALAPTIWSIRALRKRRARRMVAKTAHAAGVKPSKRRPDQAQRQGVGDQAAPMAGRIDDADGARPAQLMGRPVRPGPGLGAVVDHGQRRIGDGPARCPHRPADLVIVGQKVGEGLEAADFRQRLARSARWSSRSRDGPARSAIPTAALGRNW